jgi:tetratricopeptide (TPR) repeat protein
MEKAEDKKNNFFENFLNSFTTKKALLLILILGLIFYFNGLFGEFVGDDIPQIANNPLVHSLAHVWSFFVTPEGSAPLLDRFYRPLLFSTFAFLYSLFGTNTFFYHFFQLSLHISNAFLVFLLFKKFFSNKISLFLSLVFLLHPVNSEIVVYISGVQEPQYLFLGLLAVNLLNYKNLTGIKMVFTMSLFIFLALLFKETAVLFIPVILLFSYLYQKDKLKLAATASAISVFLYAFLRIFLAKTPFVHSTLPITTILRTTFLNIPKMIYFYISTFLYPKDLAIMYTWLVNSPTINEFYLPLVLDILFLLTLTIFGLFIFKKRRTEFSKYIFFLTWLILGILPALQLWVLDSTVAIRWLYFPIIGLLGLFGVLFSNINVRNNTAKILIESALLLVLFILGVRTIIRNNDWRTRLSLYRHDFPITNDIHTGNVLLEEYLSYGYNNEAKKLLATLNVLNPGDPVNTAYKAQIEINEKDFVSAERDLRSILETRYGNYAYQVLPKILYGKGDYQGTEELLIKGTKLYPNDPLLWKSLAYIEYKLGKLNEANEAARKINLTLQQLMRE